MRIRSTAIAAAGLGLALTLAACGQNAAAPSAPASSAAAAPEGATKVGVILPETESSARWEGFDKPLLAAAHAGRGPARPTSRTPRATSRSSPPWPTA